MASEPKQRVVITGIDVPFFDWVVLLIKLAIASIPATLILTAVFLVVGVVLSMFGAGLGALLTN